MQWDFPIRILHYECVPCVVELTNLCNIIYQQGIATSRIYVSGHINSSHILFLVLSRVKWIVLEVHSWLKISFAAYICDPLAAIFNYFNQLINANDYIYNGTNAIVVRYINVEELS